MSTAHASFVSSCSHPHTQTLSHEFTHTHTCAHTHTHGLSLSLLSHPWCLDIASRLDRTEAVPDVFTDPIIGPKVKAIIAEESSKISDDSLTKIARQLGFWHKQNLSEDKMLSLTQDLVDTATILDSDFQCPKVRFGRTELQMPILTCGSMRIQYSWMPDSIPISPGRSGVLKSSAQKNLMDAVRTCIKKGINHFETARMYGTSEYQLAEALEGLMKAGEIKREDFIFQTKIACPENRETMEKRFAETWKNVGEKLGHIDLFAFHCVSKAPGIDHLLDDSPDMPIAAVLQWQKEGKIKHIGFSTHGPADNIRRMIDSNKFSFVNIHAHYLSGSYHAEGTDDTVGGHGNIANVQRAKELDMGIFLISPIDKGGRLFHPSAKLATTLGPKMPPIAYANLGAWEKTGMHTVSIGVARASDLEENLASARMFVQKKHDLDGASKRVADAMDEALGVGWEEDMVGLPSCEAKVTDNVAIGHILFCYHLVKSLGMYDFARDRYRNLEAVKWEKKLTFEENFKKNW